VSQQSTQSGSSGSASGASVSGLVVTFGVLEGAGTVTDGQSIWPFHCTQISSGARTISVGSEVEFDVSAGLPGVWEAIAVRARSGLFLCPVCAASVPGEPGSYEICGSCGWEDDPVQRDDADATGANSSTLRRARDSAMRTMIEQQTGEMNPLARG
jgi:cold shock CspA family protein